jgi:hypothetical protein
MFLTPAELDALCDPLKQPAAQVRHLRSLGLTVGTTRAGRPIVLRSHAEAVLSGQEPVNEAPAADPAQRPQQPNRDALVLLLRGKQHGKTPQVESA